MFACPWSATYWKRSEQIQKCIADSRHELGDTFADTYYTFRGLHRQLHTIKKDVEHVICPRGTVSGSRTIQ